MADIFQARTPRRGFNANVREHSGTTMDDMTRVHSPRLQRAGSGSRRKRRSHSKEPSFIELYPHFECDALATQTITQLLLMEKEDFQILPGYDTQKAQHMALYRFLLHADKKELYAGTADPQQVAIKACQVREKSENNLLAVMKKAKKVTPRSPKRKVRLEKANDEAVAPPDIEK